MKILLSAACMLLYLLSAGQVLQVSSGQILRDINGKPYLANSYEAYEGSALLFKDWRTATVITTDGKKYEGMLVNVDLHQSRPLFMRDAEILAFADPVAEIHAQDEGEYKVFKKGSSIEASLDAEFYQVLSTTPLVLKKNSRKVADVQGYGTSTKQYKFVESKTYHARIDDKIHKIGLSRGDAEKVFRKSWKEIQEMAAKNNISFKTEEGWIALAQAFEQLNPR